MNRRKTLPASVVACALLMLALATGEPKADQDKDFVPIFNGKDLTGWHKNPQRIGHGTGGQWRVEEGAIVGQQDPPGSGNGGILLTDEKFKDFEVTFECNPDWGEFKGNTGGVCSGFFLRGNDRGQCYQMMVDYHEDGNVGEIYGEGLGGFTNRTFSLKGEYAVVDGKKQLTKINAVPVGGMKSLFPLEDWPKIWKVGTWNKVRVRMTGNPPTITTWINGTKITEFQDKQKRPELGEAGSIAVQVHGGQGWPNGAFTRFRNLHVKKL